MNEQDAYWGRVLAIAEGVDLDLTDAIVRRLTRGSVPVEAEQFRRTPEVVMFRLRAAGFSLVEAAALATNPHLEPWGVERAATLVEQGCPTVTAMRIVWSEGEDA